MKHTLITSAFVAILGLAFLSAPITAQAQTTTATSSTAPATAPAKPAKKKSDKIEYKGNITAIDASSVTVASKEKTLTLAIAPTTKYQKDGKTATLADFAVGDAVTGSYTKDSTGALTAYSLHKKKSAAPASKPAATAPAPATSAAPSTTTTPAAQ